MSDSPFGGVTMAEAAANLRTHFKDIDPAEFEAQIAAHRPGLWKRMNKRPSRLSRFLRRLRP